MREAPGWICSHSRPCDTFPHVRPSQFPVGLNKTIFPVTFNQHRTSLDANSTPAVLPSVSPVQFKVPDYDFSS